MSKEIDPGSRPYRLGKRMLLIDETRRRIVEATVELHGTVGPARTTVLGIAERAGVTRATVYRHFPDDDALFDACSAHWLAQQTSPAPSAWLAANDPTERLRTGLADLYRFYRAGEAMLTRLYRDKSALPIALRDRLDASAALYRDTLLDAFASGHQSPRLRAVLGHAVHFWTWRSLCVDNGLADGDAVELVVEWAARLGGPTTGGTA